MLLLVAALPAIARADNPIVQTIYTADPAPLVYNGRVYLYTGHDEDGSTYFTMREWRVWSSADMVNWTDHGSPMSLATFSWAERQRVGGPGRRPQRQVLLVRPGDGTGRPARMAIGVAVSDSPTGPFRDALGRPLVENGEIDPTVFIDDDGQAYLYWGNPNLWYVRLNADMISYSGSADPDPADHRGLRHPHRQRRPPDAVRGRALGLQAQRPVLQRVRGGVLLGVHRLLHRPRPDRAVDLPRHVMPTQGSSFTNHAGVIDFNGGSYFFYHNGALPGGGGFTRSVAVEKFTYNADGTHPDDQHDHHRSTAGRHAQPVRPPGGRDDRLGLRHRDRAVQRGRDERRLDRERRLDQGQGRRLRRRRHVLQRAGGLGHQRRPHRAAAGQRRPARSWAPAPCPAPAAGRPGRPSPARSAAPPAPTTCT